MAGAMQNKKNVSKTTGYISLLHPNMRQDNVLPDLRCEEKSKYISVLFLTPFSCTRFRLLSIA